MSDMTWIRLELPDWIHRRLKAKAALKGVTLRDYLIEILKSEADDDEGGNT